MILTVLNFFFSGQELWKVWTHQIHPLGGPGHHPVWLALDSRHCPESQDPHDQGRWNETGLQQASSQVKAKVKASAVECENEILLLLCMAGTLKCTVMIASVIGKKIVIFRKWGSEMILLHVFGECTYMYRQT